MSELDPSIFELYAEHLERRANAIVARWTAVFGIVGALLGAVLQTPWANWPIQGQEARLVLLLGGVCGLVLGHSFGSSRALGFRLQAQLAQHQLQFELTTLAKVAAAQEAVRESVREPVPVPVVAPQFPAGMPPVTASTPETVQAPAPPPAIAPVPVLAATPAPAFAPASVPVTAPVIAPTSAPAP